MILRRELDLTRGFKSPFRKGNGIGFRLRNLIFVRGVVALVEANGGFQHQENIVPGLLNFANRTGNAFGIGQRFVDRIA